MFLYLCFDMPCRTCRRARDLCVAGIDYRRANPNIVSLKDSLWNDDLNIYPNPASTELNFEVQNSNGCLEDADTRIEILDILGNSIIKKEYHAIMLSGKINISILANGAYIIKYSCGNNVINRQSFVVNK